MHIMYYRNPSVPMQAEANIITAAYVQYNIVFD